MLIVFRPKCLDIVLFAAIAFAISDSIKNSDIYSQISQPF
jgi:hypothetical protein